MPLTTAATQNSESIFVAQNVKETATEKENEAPIMPDLEGVNDFYEFVERSTDLQDLFEDDDNDGSKTPQANKSQTSSQASEVAFNPNSIALARQKQSTSTPMLGRRAYHRLKSI